MSRYPAELTEPMRAELQQMGVKELRTPEEVDRTLSTAQGTVLVFVNSVCGCAAGSARPGLGLSLRNELKPDLVTTVFAGVDLDAVERARSYFSEYPPSSPQVALFKDGKLVDLVQRHHIEGTAPEMVANRLVSAYNKHCR